jgi:hypothetical protein
MLMSTVAAVSAIPWVAPVEAPAQEPVVLGKPTAVFEEPFSLISGVRELDDGRLLVSDALEESLYALDESLTGSQTISRQGQGPDEYRQPDVLFPWPGDSTVMTDLGNGRLTVIGPDYGFGRTIPVVQTAEAGLLIILPQGVDAAGRLYYRPQGDGEIRDTADVLRWSPDGGGDPEAVARVKLRDVTERTSGGAGNVQQQISPVPLSPQDGWAIGPDGSVAVVRAGDYHVDWIRPDGGVVSGPPVPYEPVPVKQADKEEWAEDVAANGLMMMVTNENGQMNARMRRGGGRGAPSVDRFQWPEEKPPFDPDGVNIAPDDRLWVARYEPAGDPPVIDVFDRRGQHVGTVVLPEGRYVIGFGEESVYLARRDDLGFQWLERYERPEI